jgi:hypothetical protein
LAAGAERFSAAGLRAGLGGFCKNRGVNDKGKYPLDMDEK